MTRKIYTYIAMVLVLISVLSYDSRKTESVYDKLIRFHVIANSDSQEDQNMKLKVRDAVLKDIGPKLETSKSKDESKQIINNNLDFIKESAQKEVAEYGKNYGISVILGKSVFPTKMYSDIVLPAGEYDSLKVVIGDGKGKNWWCVMFPPLCFVDITRGITNEDTEERLKTVLSDSEYDSILNRTMGEKIVEPVKKPIDGGDSENSEGSNRPKMKFKAVEITKSLLEKIKNANAKK